MNKIWIYILCVFLCSCTREIDISTCSIDVTEDYAESDFFSDYSYVQLEGTVPAISNISDVRVTDNRIFVRDKAERLYVFAKDGKYINVLNNRGHAKNEYVNISDFDVDEHFIFILSRTQKKVLKYSIDAEFISSYDLNDFYNGVRAMSNNRLCLASENSNNQMYNYIIYDMNNNSYTSKFCPFSKNESMLFETFHPFLGRNSDTLYVTSPFTTEMTELLGLQIGKTREFSFNTKIHLPNQHKELSFEEKHKYCQSQSVVKNLSLYGNIANREYISFEMFGEYGLSSYLSVIDSDGKSKTMMMLNNIDKNYPYVSSPYCIVDNVMVSSMSASSILNIEKFYNLSKFTSLGLKEEDNPVLFFHTLK